MIDLAAADRLLSTTRSVRKRLDFSRPVADELILECIEVALQAPTGSNLQGWSFIVVTDPDKKRAIGDIYAKAFALYATMPPPEYDADDPRAGSRQGVVDSATYLAEHMHEAPALLIPCIEGRVEEAGVLAQASVYGSILPAVWSFMLAARARGLGTAWTSLHLMYEGEAAEVLEIPPTITQTALLPIAYYTGDDFKPAKRLPAEQLTYWDGWGRTR
ncbi:MAG TPA: nitroreductase family protein [Acidimicrobiales bacterium]